MLRLIGYLAAALMLSASLAQAETVQAAGTSHNWQDTGSWLGNKIPAVGDVVVLGNVTSTTGRVITIDRADAACAQLTMAQTSSNITNRLYITGQTLTLSDNIPLAQICTSWNGLETILGSGSRLVLSATGAITFQNSGCLFMNSSQVQRSAAGATNYINSGELTLCNSTLGSSSVSGTGGFAISNGTANGGWANLHVAGTCYLGSNLVGGVRTLDNYQWMRLSGMLALVQDDVAGQAWTVTNHAGATMMVGESTGYGSCVLAYGQPAQKPSASTEAHNAGTMSLYSQSRYDFGNNGSEARLSSSGRLDLMGWSKGVSITSSGTPQSQTSLTVENNGGEINVGVYVIGTTSRATISADEGTVELVNTNAGTVTQADATTLALKSRSSTASSATLTNDSGSTFTVGTLTGGAVLQFDTSSDGHSLLDNYGYMELQGSSVVALTDQAASLQVDNYGILTLGGSPTIGTSQGNVDITNYGILSQVGIGTAKLLSARTFVNYGPVEIQDTLLVESAVVNEGDIMGAGRLQTPLLEVLSGEVGVAVSGGEIRKTGPGMAILSGSNTYTGPTRIVEGLLSINADCNLGAGSLVFAGGSLMITGSMTTSRNVMLENSASENDINITSGATAVLSGPISGTGSAGLTKTGQGKLVLSGSNTYAGDTVLMSGQLELGNHVAGGLTVQSGASMSVTAPASGGNGLNIGGRLDVAGALTDNGNAVRIGAHSASLTEAAYTITMVGGLAGGLDVDEDLSLSGTSTLQLIFPGQWSSGTGGATALGGQYTILTYASHSGSAVVTTNFGPYLEGVDWGESALTVNIKPFLGGDFDLNGAVNVIDLANLASRYGRSANWFTGDSTGDGVVNVLDLAALSGSYGKSVSAAAAMPEPATMGLLAMGAIFLLGRRRRAATSSR